jgi:hypothetical protein
LRGVVGVVDRGIEGILMCYLLGILGLVSRRFCRWVKDLYFGFSFCLAHGSLLVWQYVHKIAPRGVYTSGKGSSAVGLTAYVTRDPDSKQLVLERCVIV